MYIVQVADLRNTSFLRKSSILGGLGSLTRHHIKILVLACHLDDMSHMTRSVQDCCVLL